MVEAKRYLVTGATGFLGTHLVRALRARGDAVVGLARRDSQRMRALGAEVRVADVLDEPAVFAAAKGCHGVFHLAGFVSRDARDAERLRHVHVEGTRRALRACKAAGVKRAVLASSSGTLGVSESPTHVAREEDTAPMGLLGRFPYYRAKLFAEREALAMSAPDFEVVSVNPSILLGPGDLEGSSTDDVRLFLEGRVPAVPAGGLSFVDVRDAAEALAAAMDRGRAGERYLLGACNLTVADFFARLARVSGRAAPPFVAPPAVTDLAAHVPAWLKTRIAEAARGSSGALGLLQRALDVPATSMELGQLFWYVSSDKAARELGFAPRDPSLTLLDTVDDLRAREAHATVPGAPLAMQGVSLIPPIA